MNPDLYEYRVNWSEEDDEHVGSCIEFPSMSSTARDPRDADQAIRAAVRDVLADMTVRGEIPPLPRRPHAPTSDGDGDAVIDRTPRLSAEERDARKRYLEERDRERRGVWKDALMKSVNATSGPMLFAEAMQFADRVLEAYTRRWFSVGAGGREGK